MKQEYWKLLMDIKAATYYYHFYAVNARRWQTFTQVACAIASSTFIISWYQSGAFHILWATLLFISQAIAIMQPFLPLENRQYAAGLIHRDATKLFHEVEYTWYKMEYIGMDDDEIFLLMETYAARLEEVEGKYGDASLFPHKKHLYDRAMNNAEIYLRRFQNEQQ